MDLVTEGGQYLPFYLYTQRLSWKESTTKFPCPLCLHFLLASFSALQELSSGQWSPH